MVGSSKRKFDIFKAKSSFYKVYLIITYLDCKIARLFFGFKWSREWRVSTWHVKCRGHCYVLLKGRDIQFHWAIWAIDSVTAKLVKPWQIKEKLARVVSSGKKTLMQRVNETRQKWDYANKKFLISYYTETTQKLYWSTSRTDHKSMQVMVTLFANLGQIEYIIELRSSTNLMRAILNQQRQVEKFRCPGK